ncbi:MAG: glycosyltransferase [Desulfamplus sp.]|nr:glycosyltransferase [Desulfamplus sp.]
MTYNTTNISVIIATLNCGETLERCLKSIVSQSFSNFDLIIIDGGSTDNTLQIINNYRAFISYWESNRDRGIYHAWNKGLKHAKGDWVCFIGGDDYFWSTDVLQDYQPHLMNALKLGIRVVHGRVARVDNNRNLIALWGKPWHKNRWQMPHGMPIGMPHTGLMNHISLFKENGNFDDNFKIAGDYEFLLRELKHKDRKAMFIDDLITVAQQIGGIADSNKIKCHRECSIARKKNGLCYFSWLWWSVYFRNFLRLKLKNLCNLR